MMERNQNIKILMESEYGEKTLLNPNECIVKKVTKINQHLIDHYVFGFEERGGEKLFYEVETTRHKSVEQLSKTIAASGKG